MSTYIQTAHDVTVTIEFHDGQEKLTTRVAADTLHYTFQEQIEPLLDRGNVVHMPQGPMRFSLEMTGTVIPPPLPEPDALCSMCNRGIFHDNGTWVYGIIFCGPCGEPAVPEPMDDYLGEDEIEPPFWGNCEDGNCPCCF